MGRRNATGNMTPKDLLSFLRCHTLAVEATTSSAGVPQAAVVGFVVSEAFEFFFDTLDTTQKIQNLRTNPRVALVVGWDQEQTAQCDGLADEPSGADLERLKALYFESFTDGPDRQHWPGLTYVRVRPTRIRYSDFRQPDSEPVEFDRASLTMIPNS
jgi:general stress protein 26